MEAKCDLVQVKDKKLIRGILDKELFFEDYGIHKKGVNVVFRYGKNYLVDNSKHKVEIFEMRDK